MVNVIVAGHPSGDRPFVRPLREFYFSLFESRLEALELRDKAYVWISLTILCDQGRINLAFFLTLSCLVFCVAFWIPATEMGLLSFFAIVGGGVVGEQLILKWCLLHMLMFSFPLGSYWGIIAPVCAEVIGLQDLPAGLSITWVVIVSPTTFAEAIALELRKPGKDRVYLDVQLFTVFMFFGATLCIWLIRGWKVGEMEERQRTKENVALGTGSISPGVESGKDAENIDKVELEAAAIRQKGWISWDLLRRLWAVERV